MKSLFIVTLIFLFISNTIFSQFNQDVILNVKKKDLETELLVNRNNWYIHDPEITNSFDSVSLLVPFILENERKKVKKVLKVLMSENSLFNDKEKESILSEALYTASNIGNLKLVKNLIELGANPFNIVCIDYGCSSFYASINPDENKVFDFYLDLIDFSSLTKEDWELITYMAISHDNIELFRFSLTYQHPELFEDYWYQAYENIDLFKKDVTKDFKNKNNQAIIIQIAEFYAEHESFKHIPDTIMSFNNFISDLFEYGSISMLDDFLSFDLLGDHATVLPFSKLTDITSRSGGKRIHYISHKKIEEVLMFYVENCNFFNKNQVNELERLYKEWNAKDQTRYLAQIIHEYLYDSVIIK